MTLGKGRLCIGHVDDKYGYSDGFCFASVQAAFKAADAWDGQGDPPAGWHRHINSGRRRPEGDPSGENDCTILGGRTGTMIYRVKEEFAQHFPIEPAWIVETFVRAHEDWWTMNSNALCGRSAEMREFLLVYASPAMTELGRKELLDHADTDRYYVAVKFDEFVRDCFTKIASER